MLPLFSHRVIANHPSVAAISQGRITWPMARKRRKSNSQRRRPSRARGAPAGRAAANAVPADQAQSTENIADSDSGPVAARMNAGMPAATAGSSRRNAADAAGSRQGATTEMSSWPTRRKRSQLVELPIQELDHVRSDLARIGLLSLGMVIVLVVLTFTLR